MMNFQPIVATLLATFRLAAIAADCEVLSDETGRTLDSAGAVGTHTASVIRSDSRPLIAYYDDTNNDLKVFDCTDANCSSGVARVIDDSVLVGSSPRIALGQSGLPVIAYYDTTLVGLLEEVVVFSCSTTDCASGTRNVLTDPAGSLRGPGGLLIRADGRPLISYQSGDPLSIPSSARRKVYDCDDAACTSGVPREIANGTLTSGISDVLQGAGGPIVVLVDGSLFSLFYCADDACTGGVTRDLDLGATASSFATTRTDDQRPVIAYLEGTGASTLSLYVCDDAECSSGQGQQLSEAGPFGFRLDVAIRANNRPTISYKDAVTDDLKLYLCNDPLCQSGTIRTRDNTEDVGDFNSLAIGVDGAPMVSYYDADRGDLKLSVCADEDCSIALACTLDSADDAGRYTSIALQADGSPIVSYQALVGGEASLRLHRCTDPACTQGQTVPLAGPGAGDYNSLAIRQDGRPIISYFDVDDQNLMLHNCLDLVCDDNEVERLDEAGSVGWFSSLAIRNNGLPIISYYDDTGPGRGLRAFDCFDVDCFDGEARDLTTGRAVGSDTSIAIRANGLPIISYHDQLGGYLMAYRCDDEACSQGSPRILERMGRGLLSSVALRPNGLPIISHYDVNQGDLRVYDCFDEDCDSGEGHVLDGKLSSIPNEEDIVGPFTSIAINAQGLPVISYYDLTNGDLKIFDCTSSSCETGIARIAVAEGVVGAYTSVALRDDGSPVVSNRDDSNESLKIYSRVDVRPDGLFSDGFESL